MDPLEYTLDELLASIEEITAAPPQDNYLTIAEWSSVWGKSKDVTREAIKALIGSGRMERGQREVVSLINGHRYKVNAFGVKDE